MKYIRTKDRIFEDSVPNQEREKEILLRRYRDDFGECRIADTIEELCDEAVVKESWRSKPITIQVCGCSDLFTTTRQLYLGKSSTESIYGAIWTDKGLIYVAKMNDKGELELL